VEEVRNEGEEDEVAGEKIYCWGLIVYCNGSWP